MDLKQKLYDLKNTRKALIDEAKALILEGTNEDYTAKMATVTNLNNQIEGIEQLLEQEGKAFKSGLEPVQNMVQLVAGGMMDEEDKSKAAVKAFATAARAGFPVTKDMSEGSNEDGGYTVPEDIVTRVETLRDAKFSLRQLVGVETVTAPKGRRTFKKRTQQTGFSLVGEGGKVGKMGSPQFSVLNYAVKKYAGFLPVTSELLEDSDDNITQAVAEWIAGEARVTDNVNILAVIKEKTVTALAGLDDIRRALIVTIGSAFLATSKIITNDNGLFWLSTLKDANGRDLLTPIPSDTGKMQLSVGANVVPVEIIPNGDLSNNGTKIPFILGDLVEGIRIFDRKALTITASDVAVAGTFNAYEQDMTLTRAILRQDVKERDGAAYLYCELDTETAVQTFGGEMALSMGEPIYTEAQLNGKTKAELMAIVDELGIAGVTSSNTNVELVAAILAAVAV